jgi:hypothetical protein
MCFAMEGGYAITMRCVECVKEEWEASIQSLRKAICAAVRGGGGA